MQSLTSVADMM